MGDQSFASQAMGVGLASDIQAKLLCFGAPNQAPTAQRTAAGTTIADATVCNVSPIDLTTVASGTGIQLSEALRGRLVVIYNGGANTVNIFPQSSTAVINSLSAGAAFTLATTKIAIGYALSDTTWRLVLLN